jgi:hypothetical protein
MSELDVLADTDFRERAIAAVEKFIATYGCPVARSQIAGLRQIAAHEPRLLPDFAGKQKMRADKRYLDSNQKNEHYAHESRFWELIVNLCNGTQPKHPWSLAQARDQALPGGLRVEKQAPGARLSKEEQAALKQRKDDRERWLRRWEQEHYPIFFQRFCAHYLYKMPPDAK